MNKTELLNPTEQIKRLFKVSGHEGELKLPHIEYDSSLDVDYDYQIIRESSHDGTMLFTLKVISEALEPLVKMESYCNKDLTEEEVHKVKKIEYTVGNIKLESEYKKVNTKVGEIPVVTNTVYIPVRCKYTY